MYVEPAPDPNPIALAGLPGSRSVGIPTFENQNGRMMESDGGAAIMDVIARKGHRQSVFRSYVFPYMDRPNLTVLTGALVTRITFEHTRASGVEFRHDGKIHHVDAGCEVVLSLGAINTPNCSCSPGSATTPNCDNTASPSCSIYQGSVKTCRTILYRLCLGVPAAASTAQQRRRGDLLLEERPSLDTPDLQSCQVEFPLSSPETAARFDVPDSGWGWSLGLVRPKSRGEIRLTGPDPVDPVEICANFLSDPDDVKAAIAGVELCREIGNSPALGPFVKREVMPGSLTGAELERYVRDAAVSYWHQTCTAKMGQDSMSVVNGELKVYGVEGLRIADGSIMPRVTTGNTMAACTSSANALQTSSRANTHFDVVTCRSARARLSVGIDMPPLKTAAWRLRRLRRSRVKLLEDTRATSLSAE